jgi:perosamine synthetase
LWFAYGRIALLEGLKLLGLRAGDSVLIPNYICNVVLAPLYSMGIEAKFYGVNRRLEPDWEAVEKVLNRKVKALLIVNYFGFPNCLEIARTMCDKTGLFLVEDNAHGFLSCLDGRPLGSYGDISFYSFRKTLAVPDGAVLVVNTDAVKHRLSDLGVYPHNHKVMPKYLAKLFLNSWSYFFDAKAGMLRAVERTIKKCAADDAQEHDLKLSRFGVSSISRHLIKHCDFIGEASKRRKMYVEWLNYFSTRNEKSLTVVFPELPNGVVPLAFPVLVEKRDEVVRALWKRNIQSYPWPFLPSNSTENYFSKRLVCLPVHKYFCIEDYLTGEEFR